jgi:hypothetical protein
MSWTSGSIAWGILAFDAMIVIIAALLLFWRSILSAFVSVRRKRRVHQLRLMRSTTPIPDGMRGARFDEKH